MLYGCWGELAWEHAGLSSVGGGRLVLVGSWVGGGLRLGVVRWRGYGAGRVAFGSGMAGPVGTRSRSTRHAAVFGASRTERDGSAPS